MKLKALINEVRGKGSKIVGYADTSKSTTIINYCGITAEDYEVSRERMEPKGFVFTDKIAESIADTINILKGVSGNNDKTDKRNY